MNKIFTILLSAFCLILISCGGDNGTGNGGGGGEEEYEQGNLLVYSTATVPSMENTADPIWDSAATTMVRVGFKDEYGVNSIFLDDTLSMKAIKAGDTIYLRASWRDYSGDVKGYYIRKSQGAGAWELIDKAEESGGEDGFFIIFDAGNNGTEKADCASMCHATANSMATTGGGNADVWAWRSVTTNPAKMAEDEWMKAAGAVLSGDALTSGNKLAYFTNWNQIGLNQPIYMHTGDTAYHGDYLYTDDTTTYVYLGYGWDEVDGYRMPAYYVDSTVYKDASAGSRWDVKTVSNYASNHWTVIFKRGMNTAYTTGSGQNDVDFTGLDSIQVTIAIANHHTDALTDASWVEHSGSIPFYIVFNRPAP